MAKMGRIVGLIVAVIIAWLAWTSPALHDCLLAQYQTVSDQSILGYYGKTVQYRLCLGNFVSETGEGIIAIFTVILGIATWMLWRATRELVEDAKKTGTDQVAAAKIAANATQAAADAAKRSADIAESTLTAAQRPWVTFRVEFFMPLIYDEQGMTLPTRIVSITFRFNP